MMKLLERWEQNGKYFVLIKLVLKITIFSEVLVKQFFSLDSFVADVYDISYPTA